MAVYLGQDTIRTSGSIADMTSMSRRTSKSHVQLFQVRESTWTVVYHSNNHIKSAYNLIASIFTFYVLSWFCKYIFNWKELQEDGMYLQWAMANFHYIFIISIFYFLCSAIEWAMLRLMNKPSLTFWIGQLLIVSAFTYLPIRITVTTKLSIFVTFGVFMEQIRVAMKMYSFVVENFRLPLASRSSFSHFTYFWFAPTLLYRPSYPKVKSRSWIQVLYLLAQFCCCIFILFSCCRRFVQHQFHDIVTKPIIIADLPSIFISCLLIGSVVAFSGWFGLLHCWLNMWAEALKFGDRLFYESWWLSKSYAEYFRTWNRVVHVWLHRYIYHPLSKTFGPKVGVLCTVVTSSIFHEYIISLSLGAFLPILSIFYVGAVVWLSFATGRLGSKNTTVLNSLVPTTVLVGYAVFLFFYSLEGYSRLGCPPTSKNGIVDFLVPRSLSCVKFV